LSECNYGDPPENLTPSRPTFQGQSRSLITSCRRAAATVCPAPLLPPPVGAECAFRRRADGNVAAVSHGQHVLTPTAAAAWRANTAVSKAAWWPWPLTFWPWKWCPSHVCRGLPLCQFWYF